MPPRQGKSVYIIVCHNNLQALCNSIYYICAEGKRFQEIAQEKDTYQKEAYQTDAYQTRCPPRVHQRQRQRNQLPGKCPHQELALWPAVKAGAHVQRQHMCWIWTVVMNAHLRPGVRTQRKALGKRRQSRNVTQMARTNVKPLPSEPPLPDYSTVLKDLASAVSKSPPGGIASSRGVISWWAI